MAEDVLSRLCGLFPHGQVPLDELIKVPAISHLSHWNQDDSTLLRKCLPDPVPIKDLAAWLYTDPGMTETPDKDNLQYKIRAEKAEAYVQVLECRLQKAEAELAEAQKQIETLTRVRGGKGHPLRGISISCLEHKVAGEIERAGLSQDSTITDIAEKVIMAKGEQVVCPRDGDMGAAYIDCLDGFDEAGPSKAMLSYWWGYPFSELTDALALYCDNHKMNVKRFYVWICCFCINQHRVQQAETVSCEDFKQEFQQRLENIRHVLVCMVPWDRPGNLSRVWCIFEIFVASSNVDMEVDIIMPSCQRERFKKAISDGVDERVWRALGDVRVEHAEASVENDKVCIMQLIAEPRGPGFEKLNHFVAQLLQNWIVDSAESFITDSSEIQMQLSSSVGDLLNKMGRKDRALEIMTTAKGNAEKYWKLHSIEGSTLLSLIGSVYGNLGDVMKKLEYFEHARAILNSLGRHDTKEMARLLINIGYSKHEQQDFVGALQVYEEVENIHQTKGWCITKDHAKLLMNIGITHMEKATIEKSSYQSALEKFNQAKDIRDDLGICETPGGTALFKNWGDALRLSGQMEQAKNQYERCYKIHELLRLDQTAPRAALLLSMAIAEGENGNDVGMLKHLEVAYSIRQATGTMGSPGGKLLKSRIRDACSQKFCGKPDGSEARQLYKNAAELLHNINAKREALNLFGTVRAALHDQGGLGSEEDAQLLLDIGIIHGELGNEEDKMQHLVDAESIFRHAGIETRGGISLLIALGWVQSEKQNYDEALRLYEEARRIADKLCLEDAHLLMNIGVARAKKTDFEGALQAYSQSKRISESKGASTGAVLKYIGDLHTAREQWHSAFQAYEKALKDMKRRGRLESAAHANLLYSQGLLKGKCGDLVGKRKDFERAKEIREKTDTMGSTMGKILRDELLALNGTS